VAANGDVCKQDRYYLKALAAQDNGVPFYVALRRRPSTLILMTASGNADRAAAAPMK